jgi:hypothetical protein
METVTLSTRSPMLVPDLDRDVTAMARRQPIPPDLSRALGGRGFVQAVELKALFLRCAG